MCSKYFLNSSAPNIFIRSKPGPKILFKKCSNISKTDFMWGAEAVSMFILTQIMTITCTQLSVLHHPRVSVQRLLPELRGATDKNKSLMRKSQCSHSSWGQWCASPNVLVWSCHGEVGSVRHWWSPVWWQEGLYSFTEKQITAGQMQWSSGSSSCSLASLLCQLPC